MKKAVHYFKTTGSANTDALLNLVKAIVDERGISQVVVASVSGKTGVRAAEVFKDTNVKVIVVTLQSGLTASDGRTLTNEFKRRLEELGAKIVTATQAFGGISRSLIVSDSRKVAEQTLPARAYIPPIGDLISRVLRLFSQGMKVCVEITVMAADAGTLDMDRDVVAVAGTSKGCDTAILLKPKHSLNFFDIDIHEIIAKPYSSKGAAERE